MKTAENGKKKNNIEREVQIVQIVNR